MFSQLFATEGPTGGGGIGGASLSLSPRPGIILVVIIIVARGDDTCWDCYSWEFFCNLFRKQYIVPCSYCILFAPFAQGVIRFLKVRQCWSNLWADLVIDLMRCQSYDEDGETCDGNWPLT